MCAVLGSIRDDLLSRAGRHCRLSIGGFLCVGALVRDKSISWLTGSVRDVLRQDVLGCLVLRMLRGRVVVLLCDFDAVVVCIGNVESVHQIDLAVHDLLVNDAIRSDLTEHVKRIEPGVDRLQTNLIVDSGDGDTLDIDWAAVGFGSDLLSFAARSQSCDFTTE